LPAPRSVDRRPAQSDQLVFDRLEPFRQSPPLFRSACAHSTAIRTEPIPTPTVDFSATQAAWPLLRNAIRTRRSGFAA